MLQRLNAENYQGSTRASAKEDLELDAEYLTIREQILESPFMELASKHVRIRLQAWLSKLDGVTANLVWKRNRNNYAKLINLVCECEIAVDPFHSLPPEADLPKLSRHRINSIIDAVEREVKNGSRQSRQSSANSRDGECTGSHSLKSKDCLNQQAAVSSAQEEGESSFHMDQFARTEELNDDSISFDVKNGLFFQAAESIKSMSTSNRHLSAKNKQNMKAWSQSDNAESSAFQESRPCHYPPPKHLLVKLNSPEADLSRSFAKKQTRPQEYQNGSASISESMIDEAQQSSLHNVSNQNDTLYTELIDQDLPAQPEDASEECDFSGELSQRCRDKDSIMSHSYFSWKVEETSGKSAKQPLKFTKMIPSKLLSSRDSPMNASFQSIVHPRPSLESKECDFTAKEEQFLQDTTENPNNLAS